MLFRRFNLAWFIVSLALLSTTSSTQATIYYVKAGASGSGGNWSAPSGDLPGIITTAGPGDQVWVAGSCSGTTCEGMTYYPTTGTSRTASFQMESALEIYGGFRGEPGDEGINDNTTRPLDPTTKRPTLLSILSGDIGMPNVATDNSLHVVRAPSVSNTAILDGFVITDGQADTFSDSAGAGLWISGTNSNPVVRKCTITANLAHYITGNSGTGGGVANPSANNNTSARFEDCLFSDNRSARSGGAVFCGSPENVRFISCVFSNNSTLSMVAGMTPQGGGAIYVTGSGSTRTVTLDTCVLNNNETNAGPGGAIFFTSSGSNLIVRHSAFSSNIATGGAGGAIYLASTGTSSKLIDSQFLANECHQASSIFGGGAVSIAATGTASIHTIINSQFLGNVSNDAGENQNSGGALRMIKTVGSVSIINSLFARNSAFNGAAIDSGSATNGLVFTNVTVTDNHTYPGGNVGGLLLLVEQDRFATISNSILYGNTDGNGNDGTDAQIEKSGVGTLTVSYSCIKDGFAGTGNIGVNPLFVDPANDYRLQPCSLAIDASDYDAVPADSENVDEDGDLLEKTPDLDKLVRVFDNPLRSNDGVGTLAYTDMGAYEDHTACVLLADLNGDSEVDGLDVQPFVACVLASSTTCPCADMDVDGMAGISDIDSFASILLTKQDSPVVCAFGQRSFSDCQGNGIPDVNDIGQGDSPDCNENGIPDECEIAEGSLAPGGPWYCTADCAQDVNLNGVPDECEPDCNSNGVPDAWDIAPGLHPDLNANGLPDECEPDCNGNDVPDELDVTLHTSADCNGDGEPDECTADCNGNGQPDDCDVDPTDPDHNLQTSPDCNGNDVPDECDLALPPGFGSLDCDANEIPDECDRAECAGDPACGDCNENGIMDGCDIAAAVSADTNSNGIPDDCEGGGDAPQQGGGEGSNGDGATWEAFHEWAAGQCWGPGCADSGAAQFQRLVEKLKELGLPVTGRPMGP